MGGAFGVCGTEAFIVSGSENGEIVIWDVKSKIILQKIGAHDGVVSWVDTHPSLDLIASCGHDTTIKIWSNEEDDQEEDSKMEAAEDMDYDTPKEPSPMEVEVEEEH